MSDQEREDQLWTAFMVALSRHHTNYQLWQEAWHRYVLTGMQSAMLRAVWDQTATVLDASREAMQEADKAWRLCAYPLHGIPLRDEDKCS
jgi:hypothetical protein